MSIIIVVIVLGRNVLLLHDRLILEWGRWSLGRLRGVEGVVGVGKGIDLLLGWNIMHLRGEIWNHMLLTLSI
jgi:hypothetical protein